MTVDDEEPKSMGHNSVNISGGTFSGATAFGVGDGATASARSDSAQRPTQDDLSTALKTVRDELVAAGRTRAEQQDIADELRKMVDALDSGKAEKVQVAGRWSLVQNIIGSAATAGTAIAETTGKISEMITAVFAG